VRRDRPGFGHPAAMTTAAAAAERDRHGYLAHPEAADWSGAADQLAAEAWADLDWEE
jgi:hypothetical protein